MSKLSAAIWAVVWLVLGGLPAISLAQDQEIRVGLAHAFSGPMATSGAAAEKGAQLAIKEINESGGILGRQVTLVTEDTAANPNIGEKAVERLVIKENVDIVIGIVSSAVAVRVTPLMARLECPLIITHAMADEVTTSLRNPWVFRLTWNVDQCFHGAALVAKDLGVKRWTTIGPDYGLGKDAWKRFNQFVSQSGDQTFDEGVFTPLSTTDWKPAIEILKKTGADGVMVSLWGDNARAFIKTAREEGFLDGKQVICPIAGSVDVFMGLRFGSLPPGVWFGSPYWFEAYDNESNRKFIQAYSGMSELRIPPAYAAYTPYAAVKMFKAAAEKAGTVSRDKIAAALEGLTVTDLPGGSTTFRKEDHQAVFSAAFGQSSGKAAMGTSRIQGWNSIRLFDVTGMSASMPKGASQGTKSD